METALTALIIVVTLLLSIPLMVIGYYFIGHQVRMYRIETSHRKAAEMERRLIIKREKARRDAI